MPSKSILTVSLLSSACRRGARLSRSRPDRRPSAGHGRELFVEPPAVGARRPVVFEARALQRHAAGVLADRADLPELLRAQQPRRPGAAAQRGELRALVLDRPRAVGGVGLRTPGSASGRRSAPPAARGSRRKPAAASSGRGARRSGASARAARGPPPPSRRGGTLRWSWGANSCPGSTSSWNRPP